MNGMTKRIMTPLSPEELPISPQHEDIIRYIYDQWSRISQEVDRYQHNGSDRSTATYFQGSREQQTTPKDFKSSDTDNRNFTRPHHTKSSGEHRGPSPP